MTILQEMHVLRSTDSINSIHSICSTEHVYIYRKIKLRFRFNPIGQQQVVVGQKCSGSSFPEIVRDQ